MTERLYYVDGYCTSFSAYVVEYLTWKGRPAAVLDRSAFYPTSGGQPADRGTLDGVAVLDVVVREQDQEVIHILEHSLGGVEVQGTIDWRRRFDHMQQHTGQHILSAAFEQLLDADTVGFHLGEEISTVDINVPRLELAAATPVEELSNQVIWDDRPVEIRFVDRDELNLLPLRRPLAVDGPVRLVNITGTLNDPGESFDVNPCGGTHVARTGEIGLIKIVRLEYRGDETRVEFVCGARALGDYKAKNAMTRHLASMLTVGYWELDQAVERLQAEGKRLRHDLRRARKQLLDMEASELATGARDQEDESYRVTWKVWGEKESFPGELPRDLRALSQELVQHPGMVALLAGVDERTHLCFARADGIDLDVAKLLRDACAQLGGRGGGQPAIAQGSAPMTDVNRVRTVLASLVASLELPDR